MRFRGDAHPLASACVKDEALGMHHSSYLQSAASKQGLHVVALVK